MKKTLGIVLFLILLILFSAGVSAAEMSEITETVSATGLADSNIISFPDNYTTRGELAYSLLKLMNIDAEKTDEIIFDDVPKEHIYRNEINTLFKNGIMVGNGGGMFMPDQPASGETICRLMVALLGYGDAKDISRQKIASDIGIMKKVAIVDDKIKHSDFMRLLYNVLYCRTGSVKGTMSEVKGGGIYMNEVFGISECVVRINNISADGTGSAVVTEENDDYPAGTEIHIDAKATENYQEYQFMPAKILIDDENRIICIMPDKNTKVIYDYIYAVNNDTDCGHSYSGGFVTSLTLKNLDKRFKVSDNFFVTQNDKINDEPIVMTGRFARIVQVNNVIESVHIYTFETGGIITEKNTSDIVYSDSDGNTKYLKEFEKYDSKRVYIDMQPSDYASLKTNSVFDFCIYNDILIINASEYQITDTLDSVGNEEIVLGGNIYETENVYTSKDGILYSDGIIGVLYGSVVTAAFSPDGKSVYIYPFDKIAVTEFIGMVTKCIYNDDVEEYLVKVIGLNPLFDECEYKLAKKFRTNDGIDKDTFISSAGSGTNGNNIYKFRLNKNNEISEISKAELLYGCPDSGYTISGFSSFADAQLLVNGRKIYFDNADILTVYNNDGVTKVSQTEWKQLINKVMTGGITGTCRVKFFAEENSSDVYLCVIYDGAEQIHKNVMTYGLITKVSTVLNSDNEQEKELTVLNELGENTFTVPLNAAANIKKNSLIAFYRDAYFYDGGIFITDIIGCNRIAADFAAGNSYVFGGQKIYCDIVERVDKNMIRFKNGDAYFFNREYVFIASIDGKSIEKKEKSDIKQGDIVCYTLVEGAISALLLY